MDFELTDSQRMIRTMVRDFVEKEVAPHAGEWEESSRFPAETFSKMGGLGLLGLPFPEEYGGSGADMVSFVVTLEELARGSAGLALSYMAHISLGSSPIFLFGTEEQKRRWLVPCARGDILACFGLTEPNAGSDAGATETTAVRDGGEWVINGSKCFITNASVAGVAVITALTEKGKGTRGISSFIVPGDAPGFRRGSRYDKIGLKCSDTAELFFEDCRIAAENLLGAPGEGFKQFLITLDSGRIAIAAISTGIAQAALDVSLTYAQQRVQFGQPIARFQAIQFKLADMATELEHARLFTYRAAWLKDRDRPFKREAAMAKLFASEMAVRASEQAVQIHGGYGYMKEYPVSRCFRDAKLMEIGEGTSEVQRLVIARELGC